jgi:hypothetical protein
MAKRKTDPIDRFFKKVHKTRECWIWTGTKNKGGYGVFTVSTGKTDRAHRFSYKIHKGEIEEGLCICHTCDNPSCVNPEHLFAATQKQNIHDCIKKHRNFIYPREGDKYTFISPNGEKVTFKNLSRFCRENNLIRNKMQYVLKGTRKSHKGWRSFN